MKKPLSIISMAALAAAALAGCNTTGSSTYTEYTPLKLSVSERNTTTGDVTLTQWTYNPEEEIKTGTIKIVSETKTLNSATVYVTSDYQSDATNATSTRYRTLADGTREKLVDTYGYGYNTKMLLTKSEVFRGETELVELTEITYREGSEDFSRYEYKVNGVTKILQENFQYDDYNGSYTTWTETLDGGAAIKMRRNLLQDGYETKADRDGDGTPETLTEKKSGYEEETFGTDTTVKYKISQYDAEGEKTSEVEYEERYKWYEVTVVS